MKNTVEDMKILINDMQKARFHMIDCQYKLAKMIADEPFVLELIDAEVVKPCIPINFLRDVRKRRPTN